MNEKINYCLEILNYYFGGIIVLSGLYEYFIDNSNKIPFYIALAIIIVGPLENLLNRLLEEMPVSEEKRQIYSTTIDLSTSLAFILLLGKVIKEV